MPENIHNLPSNQIAITTTKGLISVYSRKEREPRGNFQYDLEIMQLFETIKHNFSVNKQLKVGKIPRSENG